MKWILLLLAVLILASCREPKEIDVVPSVEIGVGDSISAVGVGRIVLLDVTPEFITIKRGSGLVGYKIEAKPVRHGVGNGLTLCIENIDFAKKRLTVEAC